MEIDTSILAICLFQSRSLSFSRCFLPRLTSLSLTSTTLFCPSQRPLSFKLLCVYVYYLLYSGLFRAFALTLFITRPAAMSVLLRPHPATITTPADDFPRYTYSRRLTSGTQSIASASSTAEPTFVPSLTPAPWYHFSLRTIILFSLPIFSFLGLYGTLILGQANGTFKGIIAIMSIENPKFPTTDDELLMRYTQIGWLDKQLTVLVTFFAPVVDMNQGALWMFAIFGTGQFGAAWALMFMEGLRVGNRRRIVSLYVPLLSLYSHMAFLST